MDADSGAASPRAWLLLPLLTDCTPRRRCVQAGASFRPEALRHGVGCRGLLCQFSSRMSSVFHHVLVCIHLYIRVVFLWTQCGALRWFSWQLNRDKLHGLWCAVFFLYYWILFTNTVGSQYLWILYLQCCLPTSNCFCNPLGGHLWAQAEQQTRATWPARPQPRVSKATGFLASAPAVNKCPFRGQLRAVCLCLSAFGNLSLYSPGSSGSVSADLGLAVTLQNRRRSVSGGFLQLCSQCWADAERVGKLPSPFISWKGFLVFLL